MMITTRLTSAAITVAAAFALAACASSASSSQPSISPSSPARVSVPAPSSAAEYAQAFATLPPEQWGAADVAITVPLAEHVVWLFGDTFSTGRFVHSSAIVQVSGAFSVSDDGAQLLPNDDDQHVYWISSAAPCGTDSLLITARAITLTGHGPWDFRDGGFDRTALVRLDADDDLTFVRWTATHVSPAPDPGRMLILGSHHFGYAVHTHPELLLASGRVLVTTCQNWDDGQRHPLADYRPIFTEN